MRIRLGPRECDMGHADTRIRYWPRECDMRHAGTRMRYGPREYDMRYANRLPAMSKCKVTFSATIGKPTTAVVQPAVFSLTPPCDSQERSTIPPLFLVPQGVKAGGMGLRAKLHVCGMVTGCNVTVCVSLQAVKSPYENQAELLELVSLEINHTHKWSWGPVYASHVLALWIKSQLLPPCLSFCHNYRSFTWQLVLGTSSLWITTITSLPSHQRQTSLPAWNLVYIKIVCSLPASHHFIWCLGSNIIFGNFI